MNSQGPAKGVLRSYIDADALQAYAWATNDPNELCTTGKVVPPLFTSVMWLEGAMTNKFALTSPGVITGARAHVHAVHDVHYFGEILPESHVLSTARHYGIRQTSVGVASSTEVDIRDPEGNLLVRHYMTGMGIGATVDAESGDAPPDHLFPDSAREAPIGTYVADIAPDQAFRYGGASGDRTSHAISDEAARAEGFPGKILQGLCTFAMCGGAAVKLVGGGDPRRLTRLAGRFSSPVFPRQQVTIDFYDAGLSPEGRVLVAFEATSNGSIVVKHGRAEFIA